MLTRKHTPLSIHRMKVSPSLLQQLPIFSPHSKDSHPPISLKQMNTLFQSQSKEYKSGLNRDGKTTIQSLVRSSLEKGLPSLETTPQQSEFLYMIHSVIAKIMSLPSDSFQTQLICRFAIGFQDCQQIQYRTICGLFQELCAGGGVDSLNGRILLLTEEIKMGWLHRLIFQETGHEIIDRHDETGYIECIGEIIPFMGYQMAIADKARHPIMDVAGKKLRLQEQYSNLINADDVVYTIYNSFAAHFQKDESDLDKHAAIKQWLQQHDMYVKEAYDWNDELGTASISLDTLVDMLILMGYIEETPDPIRGYDKKPPVVVESVVSGDFEYEYGSDCGSDLSDMMLDQDQDQGGEEDEGGYQYEYGEEELLKQKQAEEQLELQRKQEAEKRDRTQIFHHMIEDQIRVSIVITHDRQEVMLKYCGSNSSEPKQETNQTEEKGIGKAKAKGKGKTTTTKGKTRAIVEEEAKSYSLPLLKFAILKRLRSLAYPIESNQMASHLVTESLVDMEQMRLQCPICETPHAIPIDRCIACHQEECIRLMTELDIGMDITIMIQEEPMVVDLLIQLAYWATTARHDMYVHFPARFIKDGVRQFGLIQESLNLVPSVDVMNDLIQTGLWMEYMNDTVLQRESYQILHWLLNSNRTAFSYISAENRNEFEQKLCTDDSAAKYLFKIKNTPEREHLFACQAAFSKEQNTEIVYHGSNSNAWYSILQNSLKSYSGTEKQANGAVYGPGIYLSTSLMTAKGYIRTDTIKTTKWANSTMDFTWCYLVIEKVQNAESIRKGAPADFRVESNENNVINRYLICG